VAKRTQQQSVELSEPSSAIPIRLEAGRVRVPRSRKRAPGRPTAEQADRLREAVLHSALNAFMTKGFDAASIEGIARDAKVAKITLYRQFGTKENLFYHVTHYAQAEARRSLQSSLDLSCPPSVVLRQLIEGLNEGLTNPNYLAVLRLTIAEAERFPSVAAGMLHDTDFFLEPVIKYLRGLRDDGYITIESPREAAIQLTCLAGGGARYLMVRPSTAPAARAHWTDSLYELFSKAWNLSDSPGASTSNKKTAGPTAAAKRKAPAKKTVASS